LKIRWVFHKGDWIIVAIYPSDSFQKTVWIGDDVLLMA